MSTIAKLSLKEYERIVATGVFDGPNRRRVELIRGELREMSPIGPLHADLVAWLTKWSVRNIPTDEVSVRVQSSLAFAEADCEPEPDIVWARSERFLSANPGPADVLLLIEVADSSRSYDRGEKAELYAEVGIGDYWLVDAIDRTVEVHRDPLKRHYRDVRAFGIGEFIQPLAAANARLDIGAVWFVEVVRGGRRFAAARAPDRGTWYSVRSRSDSLKRHVVLVGSRAVPRTARCNHLRPTLLVSAPHVA